MANQIDPKRRALGKGLESLLPSRQPAPTPPPASAEPTGKPFEIEIEKIDRSPYQTRTQFAKAALDELTASIAATGVVQPIIVRNMPNGRFQLIAGERRMRASQQAGKTHIPAVVRAVSDAQAMEMTIVENLQRTDLNPMEQARAYHRLSAEFHLTQEQMAIRTGKDRTSVANFLRLLKLPETIQQRVEAAELSFGHARALLPLEDKEAIEKAAQKVLALSMSVRQAESYVAGLLNPEKKLEKPGDAAPAQDPNVREAQDQLQRTLGLRVKIEDKKGKGKVVIEYANIDDFEAILSALGSK